MENRVKFYILWRSTDFLSNVLFKIIIEFGVLSLISIPTCDYKFSKLKKHFLRHYKMNSLIINVVTNKTIFLFLTVWEREKGQEEEEGRRSHRWSYPRRNSSRNSSCCYTNHPIWFNSPILQIWRFFFQTREARRLQCLLYVLTETSCWVQRGKFINVAFV